MVYNIKNNHIYILGGSWRLIPLSGLCPSGISRFNPLTTGIRNSLTIPGKFATKEGPAIQVISEDDGTDSGFVNPSP